MLRPPSITKPASREAVVAPVAEVASGKAVKTLELLNACLEWPGWSPDGRYVAFGSWDSDVSHGLWLMDCQTGRVARCLPGPCTMPAWSKDGKRVAFDVRAGPKPGIWVIDAAVLTQALRDAPESRPPAAALPGGNEAVPGGDPSRKGPN
jgi:WD40 repeat protein